MKKIPIHYTSSLSSVTPKRLSGFFVGWARKPSPQRHLAILRGSDFRNLAVDHRGNVVGFITAISDGGFAAYITLLEVLPEYRGRGIGSQLVRRMLRSLHGHYMIDLLCDADVQPFYKKHGMKKAAGMMLRGRIAAPKKAKTPGKKPVP